MADSFITWGIVELLGHKRKAGKISESTVAGGSMLRIDVPASRTDLEKFITHFYGHSAIYGIHPCDEDMARLAAAADISKETYEQDIDNYLARINDRAAQSRQQRLAYRDGTVVGEDGDE